jgi:hypothetical protein
VPLGALGWVVVGVGSGREDGVVISPQIHTACILAGWPVMP